MDKVEVWLKSSLLFRFYMFLLSLWRNSLTGRFVEVIGRIIESSGIFTLWHRFTDRDFVKENSFLYRVFQRLNEKSRSLRERISTVASNGFFGRTLLNSFSLPLIAQWLIPLAVLYVFVDELGRDYLGSFPLFSYWDEALLVVCLGFVFMRWFFAKKDAPLGATPMGAPLLLLITVTFVLFYLNSPYRDVAFEGLRVVIQYVLWYFVFTAFIDEDKAAYRIMNLLVATGSVLAFHGLLQFVLKVETPVGWTDQAEASTGPRVFSIVGSPNILAGIMVLLAPLCFAMALQKNRRYIEKLFLTGLTGVMGLCLILTQSRMAWLSMGVAAILFCLIVNPRWLLLVAVGVRGALFIPTVASRIEYLLSPAYAQSSSTGGRILRYTTGWEMFLENRWMGVGLGHFGGAVAMNHKDLFPDTFYMDSYWLKTMVEMGTWGILAFAVVMLVLVVWSIRAVKRAGDGDSSLIAAGGFAGLVGLIFHNAGENVFEVPYMVVYFWIVAALVMYFGFKRRKTT